MMTMTLRRVGGNVDMGGGGVGGGGAGGGHGNETILIVGHSAGGALALWMAQERSLRQFSDQIRARKYNHDIGTIREMEAARNSYVKNVLAVAPVADFKLAIQLKLSDHGDATQNFLGIEKNQLAPRELLTAACPVHLFDAIENNSNKSGVFLQNAKIVITSGGVDTNVPAIVVESLWNAYNTSATDSTPTTSLVRQNDPIQHSINRISPRDSSVSNRNSRGSSGNELTWVHFDTADHFLLFNPSSCAFQIPLILSLNEL